MFRIVLVVCILTIVALKANAFAPKVSGLTGARRATLQPLQENFGLEISTLNDPGKITPRELLGEDTYRDFVGDGALINKKTPFATSLGSGPYDVIDRVRDLKLLTVTAESGLLEALEDKGVTLAQVEKLLPLVDSLGLLGLVRGNKDLIAGAAPLLIEPAPSLIPVLVSLLKTPPSTFQVAGLAVAGGGLFEVTQGNALLGAPLVLLGAPLLALGSVLGSLGSSLPSPTSYSAVSAPKPAASTGSAPGLSIPKISAPKISAPKIGGGVRASAGGARAKNGSRKTIRI